MTLSPAYVLAITIGVALYLAAIYYTDRALAAPQRVPFRYFVVAATVAGFFIGVGGIDLGPLHWSGLIGKRVMDRGRAVDITKALIAIGAAAAVFYEQQRVGQRRPIAERWKRFVGITLGLAAIVAYFDGFKPGYPKFYHRHDQYHYYLGAKYFPELGYDRLSSHNRMFLAYLDALAGDADAEKVLVQGIRYAEANDYTWDVLGGRRLLARLHQQRGEQR